MHPSPRILFCTTVIIKVSAIAMHGEEIARHGDIKRGGKPLSYIRIVPGRDKLNSTFESYTTERRIDSYLFQIHSIETTLNLGKVRPEVLHLAVDVK